MRTRAPIIVPMSNSRPPTDDELAAALAAIALILEAERGQTGTAREDSSTGWQNSAKLAIQGLQPARTRRLQWRTVERLRSGTSGGFHGVTGL